MPAVEFDAVLRATAVRRGMGGKGFNVSRFLQKLGVDNIAVAFAGGFTGQALAAGLAAAGVKTDFIHLAEGETRTNVVIHEPGTGRHIKVNQPGATVTAADQAAFWARLQELARPGDLWVLTGSLAPGLAVDFYTQVAAALGRAGAAFVLDTSGPALRSGCAAAPLLVKPNLLEAQEFTGHAIRSAQEAAAAAREFLQAGAQQVILSLGKEGAVVAAGDAALHLLPPAVDVQTAVSAGDAVVAGAIWAMQQGLPLAEVGMWAVATGTLTAMHDDLPAAPLTPLQEIAARVQVTALG